MAVVRKENIQTYSFELTHNLQVTCAVKRMKDIICKEGRRWQVSLSETVALENMANDGCGHSGNSRCTSTWISLNISIFQEMSCIDALWYGKTELFICRRTHDKKKIYLSENALSLGNLRVYGGWMAHSVG